MSQNIARRHPLGVGTTSTVASVHGLRMRTAPNQTNGQRRTTRRVVIDCLGTCAQAYPPYYQYGSPSANIRVGELKGQVMYFPDSPGVGIDEFTGLALANNAMSLSDVFLKEVSQVTKSRYPLAMQSVCTRVIGLFIVLVTACGAATVTQDMHMLVSEFDVNSGNAMLHVWGRGGDERSAVLVLINGGPGLSHESMDPLADALANPTRRVLVYDQRGVGRSSARGTEAFTPDDYLADLEAIRVHTGREKIHLLGHSFGGMVALSYVDAHPDRVTSLVVTGTAVSEAQVMAAGGARFAERVAHLQQRGLIPNPLPTATCREKFLALFPAYTSDPAMTTPAAMLRRTCDDSGRSNVLGQFIARPYTQNLGAWTGLALVLVGANEPFGLGPSQYAATALRSSEVELRTLPNCGHLGWLECEAAFLSAVRSFYARVGG